jgi:hypothetical protein
MGKAYKPAINLSISFQKNSEKKFAALNRLGAACHMLSGDGPRHPGRLHRRADPVGVIGIQGMGRRG